MIASLYVMPTISRIRMRLRRGRVFCVMLCAGGLQLLGMIWLDSVLGLRLRILVALLCLREIGIVIRRLGLISLFDGVSPSAAGLRGCQRFCTCMICCVL